MGMGNPLSPGTYYVGVINSGGTAPMTYTIASRGIGTNFSIPILDLPFTRAACPATVCPCARRLITKSPCRPISGTGNSAWPRPAAKPCSCCKRITCPTSLPAGSSPTLVNGGRALQKAGNEQYLLLPPAGQSVIPGGTYYVAVGQRRHESAFQLLWLELVRLHAHELRAAGLHQPWAM